MSLSAMSAAGAHSNAFHTKRKDVEYCLNQLHGGNANPIKRYGGHKAIETLYLRRRNGVAEVECSMDTLKDDQVRQWVQERESELENIPGNAQHVVASLQLLLIPTLWNDDDGRSGAEAEDVMSHLFSAFDIPLASLAVFLHNKVQYAEFPSTFDSQGHRIRRYHLASRQWCVAWSQNATKSQTKGLMLWTSGNWTERLHPWMKHYLSKLSSFIDQPNLLPLATALVSVRHVSLSLGDDDNEAYRRERQLQRLLEEPESLGVIDFGHMSAASSWLSARILRHRSRMLGVKALLEDVDAQHREHCSPSTNNSTDMGDSELKIMVDCCAHLRQTTDSLIFQAGKLQNDVNVQLSVLYNLIAQRDQAASIQIADASKRLAEDSKRDQEISIDLAKSSESIALASKRDSESMKSIAIVTMVFLPGTFLASCFAMPLFDWKANAAYDVVNPRIWIYFTLAAPMTILTISIWQGWLWHRRRLAGRGLV